MVLGLLAVLVAPAAPAAAVDGPVALSADGVTWADDLRTPLFDPAARWVPGDGRAASFWVRNDGQGAGALSVVAALDDGDRLLADGSVSLRMRAGGGPWATVSAGEATSLGRLAEGERTRVDVAAVLPASAGNDTMRRLLGLDLDVRLRGDDPADVPPDDDRPGDRPGEHETPEHETPEDEAGLLPDTGSPVTTWLLLVAAACVGAGAACVRRSRGAAS